MNYFPAKPVRILRFVIRLLPVLLLPAILSCSPVRHYAGLPAVKAWEPDIAQFDRLSASEEYAPDAVIFAGSSSIRMWSTLAEDMKPYNVIQRGYGGARMSDFAVYAERIFAPLPGRALVLFVANDIVGGDDDNTPEIVSRLFRDIVRSFRKSHPKAPVFWVAITPTSSRWHAWPEVSRANGLIREVCARGDNLYYIDTAPAFLNEEGRPRDELFLADRLHLNREGYLVWTGIIRGELDRVLR